MDKGDTRGWIAIAGVILGGLLFWFVGKELKELYPIMISSRGALLEGAALRFSFMPLGMLLFYILFREWFDKSGIRLLIAGVQWLILALSLSIILKQPWELYGTLDLVNGYVGAPYAVGPAGIIISTLVFLVLMVGTLLITNTARPESPKWEKWLEYSPLFVALILFGLALWFHDKPTVPKV